MYARTRCVLLLPVSIGLSWDARDPRGSNRKTAMEADQPSGTRTDQASRHENRPGVRAEEKNGDPHGRKNQTQPQRKTAPRPTVHEGFVGRDAVGTDRVSPHYPWRGYVCGSLTARRCTPARADGARPRPACRAPGAAGPTRRPCGRRATSGRHRRAPWCRRAPGRGRWDGR